MSEINETARAAIDAIDASEIGDQRFARQIRLLQERPDLMFLDEDDDAERGRKVAEFDALMLAGEVKH